LYRHFNALRFLAFDEKDYLLFRGGRRGGLEGRKESLPGCLNQDRVNPSETPGLIRREKNFSHRRLPTQVSFSGGGLGLRSKTVSPCNFLCLQSGKVSRSCFHSTKNIDQKINSGPSFLSKILDTLSCCPSCTSTTTHRLRKKEDWTRNFRSVILQPISAQFTTMTVVHFLGT
jgi:hypothetical protein